MLQAGQRFKYDDKVWRVLYVNPCRAHCKCESKKAVTVKGIDRQTGEDTERTFQTTAGSTINIAPDSFVQLVGEDEVVTTTGGTAAPKPAPVARPAKGWHLTGVAVTLKEGSRMAILLAAVTEQPGITAPEAIERFGKGADQILGDLKRKGAVVVR